MGWKGVTVMDQRIRFIGPAETDQKKTALYFRIFKRCDRSAAWLQSPCGVKNQLIEADRSDRLC